MLSDDERRDIEHEMSQVPLPESACIGALEAVQRRRGWVPDEAIPEIAELLGMSPHAVDSVASFYNLIFRHPVGRHVILFCDSVSCWVLRSERLLDALRARLGIDFGETTTDGRFTLLPIQCLGACDRAPVLMVDEDTHRNVTPGNLDEILARYE